MAPLLTDLSDSALVNAIKANLLEFFRYLGCAAQTDFYADDRYTRWHTQLPHPWFNGVIALQPPGAEDVPFIEETTAYFRSRDVSLFTWWTEPQLSVAAWADALLPLGFQLDRNTPGMAIDLQTLPEKSSAPETVTIVPVEDHKTLKRWVHTFIRGYELPLAWEDDLLDLWTGLGLDLPMRNYLGCLQGQAVATANLFLGAGVAGVQCIATVPEARGRGLGRALTWAPLFDARTLGYRAGILQSSGMGFKVYQRLGFKQLCDMEHFYRSSENDRV